MGTFAALPHAAHAAARAAAPGQVVRSAATAQLAAWLSRALRPRRQLVSYRSRLPPYRRPRPRQYLPLVNRSRSTLATSSPTVGQDKGGRRQQRVLTHATMPQMASATTAAPAPSIRLVGWARTARTVAHVQASRACRAERPLRPPGRPPAWEEPATTTTLRPRTPGRPPLARWPTTARRVLPLGLSQPSTSTSTCTASRLATSS